MTLLDTYASLVAQYFDITVKQLKSRDRKCVEARKWFYYISRINNIPEREVAEYVKRDRSTINDVFNLMNRRVDKFKQLTKIKNELINESAK